MPKVAKELSSLEVRRLKEPGMYFVGGVAGLLLQVKDTSSSWILRTRVAGARKHLGLGGYPQVSLADARGAARKQLEIIKSGIDPVAKKRSDKSRLRLESARAKTFKDCAHEYLNKHNSTYSNEKHAKQWITTLETYVYPIIGNILVSDVSRANILQVVEQPVYDSKTNKKIGQFWYVKTETASRVLNRIKSIIDFAIVAEYRTSLNPATWSGYMDTQLPAPGKLKKVKHQPAIPYSMIGDFMVKLRANQSISAKALEFLVLTAVRSGSVRAADWSEIDFDKKIWVIPPEHNKTRQLHRVPLSNQAIKLLKSMPKISGINKIFPSSRTGTMLSDMALSELMRGMRDRGELTDEAVPHGFRSTFRDWAAEQTNYPDDIRKVASGHSVGDAVQQAYQRTDLLEKRRELMMRWADFLDKPSIKKSDNVVKLRKVKSA
jgi:integrase